MIPALNAGHPRNDAAQEVRVVKEAIFPADVAPPGNPYSPAIRCGGSIFISGQVAKDPETRTIAGTTVSEPAGTTP